jgi:Cu+-exporting ATPase
VSVRRAVTAAALVAALAAAAAAAAALLAPPAALDRARPGRSEASAGGEEVVALEVAGGAYAPNVVHVRAGAPVRLRVTVRERHGCATRLLVPDLAVDLALVPGGTAEAVVPPPPPGAHVFTCGMKMVKGTIVVE